MMLTLAAGDIPHICTHLASKSHLSVAYKLRVLATESEDARRIIDQYDAWYEAGNIDQLICKRMSHKEKKRLLERFVPGELSAVPTTEAAADKSLQALLPLPRIPLPVLLQPSERASKSLWILVSTATPS